jgi:hypothetical protein
MTWQSSFIACEAGSSTVGASLTAVTVRATVAIFELSVPWLAST